MTLFEKEGDYEAFQRVLEEAWQRVPIRILDYVVMPNHWHFVVWPETDEQTSEFFYWLALTHTMRWHAHHQTSGTGHLYQGRFKSFPVQEDDHLYSVLRYVERNPLRSKHVRRAENWRWGSAWLRSQTKTPASNLLSCWPVPRPRKWLDHVHEPQTEAELAALRRCVQRGTPYGSDTWITNAAARLGLEFTLRPRGRPKKES